MRTQVYLKRMK